MADQVRIDIYLNGSADENVNAGAIAGQEVKSTPKKESGDKANDNIKALGKFVASQTVGTFLSNAKSTITESIGLVSGRSDIQQKINTGMELVQKGNSVYSTAMAGSILAEKAGMSSLAGGWIGAIVAVLGIAVETGFDFYKYNQKQTIENKQLNYLRSRAGASYNGSRSS